MGYVDSISRPSSRASDFDDRGLTPLVPSVPHLWSKKETKGSDYYPHEAQREYKFNYMES